MRVSVITFPGSTCDRDAYRVFKARGHETSLIWHKDKDLEAPDLLILPGGSSYGDYLRCGALARFSPIVDEIIAFAEKGGLVLGICNGFQILTEIGLVPGALLINKDLRFICKHQYIKVESENSPFSGGLKKGSILKIPIAHKDGNFYIDEKGLKNLQDEDRILFRYSDSDGNYLNTPNGAIYDIAGVLNKGRNVLGMMPHPERAAMDHVENRDGKKFFEAIERFFDGGN